MTNYKKQKYLLLNGLQDCNILKSLKEHKAIIAGGAIRAVFANEKISDYDIYFSSRKDLNEFKEVMKKKIEDKEFKKVFVTETATTYKYLYDRPKVIIQLITLDHLFKSANEIIKEFDFTVCMGAYDITNDDFVLHENFLEHLSRKELHYNINCKYPIGAINRVKKYMNKGYNISGIEIVKIALAINNLKMNDYRALKEQLMGIDTMFLKDLTDVMMSPEYENKKYEFGEFINFMDTFYDNKIDNLFNYQEDDSQIEF